MIITEKFYIGYSSTNQNLELSDSAILKMFEDVATMHGEMAGDSVKTTSIRWFLTAYDVRIHKRPKLDERVECRTWSHDMRGFVASREFEVYNEDGELVITATSNWARVDIKTGRLERVTPETGERYGTEKDRTNFESPWIGKLKEPDEYQISKEYYVDRNFIDANNHMNNVCYLDLAKCILPDAVYEKKVTSFEIMYRKAIEYGKTVTCHYSELSDGCFIAIKCDGELMSAVKFGLE